MLIKTTLIDNSDQLIKLSKLIPLISWLLTAVTKSHCSGCTKIIGVEEYSNAFIVTDAWSGYHWDMISLPCLAGHLFRTYIW